MKHKGKKKMEDIEEILREIENKPGFSAMC